MMQIITKTLSAPPVSKKEIMRYARGSLDDAAMAALLERCLDKAQNELAYRLCYVITDISFADGVCDFGSFKLHSKSLAKNLSGCTKAVIFAATLGIGIDKLIAKSSRLSPAEALMLQAIGAERIEALCDAFEDELKNEGYNLCPRFSTGYGDAPLDAQEEIITLLSATKNIGISLGKSMIMMPSKSITAFIGIRK